MNKIIKDWRETCHGFIQVNKNLQLDALMFADDLILIGPTKKDLQYLVYNPNTVSKMYNMEMNVDK